MALCIDCGEEYSDKRKSIGYDICLDCGDGQATKEIRRKAKSVAPAYNKGTYQYIASVQEAKDIGR